MRSQRQHREEEGEMITDEGSVEELWKVGGDAKTKKHNSKLGI